MNEPPTISTTKFSTVGGLITILLANIGIADIVKTILLAAIGTTISFFISLLLKMVISKWRKR
jgi:hypothetical protein